jgi:predicted pyridoxine 5'-phosphate oxidase superfamily flavin-nucleotide-binding protein
MSSVTDSVRAYKAAVSNPSEETAAALAPHLEDDVVVVGIVGGASTRDGAIAALQSATASRLLAAAAWSEPRINGDTVVVDAMLPAGAPLGGLSVELTVSAAGKIAFIGQSLIAAGPTPASPIAISEEMRSLIAGALANGTPVILSYVDAEGAPHLSPRGTVQVYDEQRLATWARDPQAGLPRALESNPRIALLYRDPKARTSYSFSGRARIASDEATRDRVYANSPEVERNLDGRRRGVAVVIDLDIVEGSAPSGRVNMRRA